MCPQTHTFKKETPICTAAEQDGTAERASATATRKQPESIWHNHAEAEYASDTDGANMACFHPIPAYRSPAGELTLHKEVHPDSQPLQLPCGNCLGCRTQRAQGWALRCQLEYQQHTTAVFATLTYDDEHLPLTLDKTHVSAYLKKIRKALPNKLRFFASGEYGETTQRPHYHAIIYGASEREASRLEKAWTQGHVRIDQATPARISYTAGYCSKKIGYRRNAHERVDPLTNNRYQWQPPFIQMSRNPGIGANAKHFVNSWRLYAIKDGHKMKVPRYLHQAWKATATQEEIEELQIEIEKLKQQQQPQDLKAAEQIAEAKQRRQAQQRGL